MQVASWPQSRQVFLVHMFSDYDKPKSFLLVKLGDHTSQLFGLEHKLIVGQLARSISFFAPKLCLPR